MLRKLILAGCVLCAVSIAAIASACGGGSSYRNSSGASPAPTRAQVAATAAPQESTVKLVNAGSLGPVLTDASGKTLYIFTKDQAGSGKSVCNGGCAQAWPPLLLPSGDPVKPQGLSGDLTVITRDDGTREVAFNGQPLYYYSKDSAPGDTNGQGVGNVWFAAQPSGAASSGQAIGGSVAGASNGY